MRFALIFLLALAIPGAAMAQGKDLLNKAAKGAIDAVIPPTEKAAEGQALREGAKPRPGDLVENPAFARWSPFAVGTTIRMKELVTFSDGSVAAPVTTSKLVSKSKDSLTIETVISADASSRRAGAAEQTRTVTDYPAKVKFEDPGAVAADAPASEGKEILAVKGKEIEASWAETTTVRQGETIVEKQWIAAEIPGGVVKKLTTRKKGPEVVSTSTLELIEYAARAEPVPAATR